MIANFKNLITNLKTYITGSMERSENSLGNGITFIEGKKASDNIQVENTTNTENVENNQETTQASVNKKDLAKVVNLKHIGMPVSGKPWKKCSLT